MVSPLHLAYYGYTIAMVSVYHFNVANLPFYPFLFLRKILQGFFHLVLLLSLIFKVNNACATGSSALFLAKQLVEGSSADCVLALGFEKMERGSLGSKV